MVRPVGILGGMGPEATLYFMQKCLKAVHANGDSDHIPLIVHQNPQVPSRIDALIKGVGDDPAPVLAQMAQDLEAAGAACLAMPCNTAHRYADTIRAASSLPFLDMTVLSAEHLAGLGVQRIGMLASPAVRLAGIYDAPFSAVGLSPVFLSDDSALLSLIEDVKSGGAPGAQRRAIARLARALISEGCDHLLIAGTELSLLTDSLPDDITHSDSLDCLVAEIAARHIASTLASEPADA